MNSIKTSGSVNPSSVSTFKHGDFSTLKHLCMGPLHYPTLSLVSVLTFKCDVLSTLKHLCILSTTPKKCQKIHQKNAQTFMHSPTSTIQVTLRVTNKIDKKIADFAKDWIQVICSAVSHRLITSTLEFFLLVWDCEWTQFHAWTFT